MTHQRTRREIISVAAGETTAHGLSRTVGGRHIVARIIWAMVFTGWLIYFVTQFFESVQKLRSKPTSTSVEPNSINFSFPSIHICPDPTISPSYFDKMPTEQKIFVNETIYKISNLLQSVRKSSNPNNEIYEISRIFTSSVNYSFISSFMGQRKEQNIIGISVQPGALNLKIGTEIKDLHHHKFLNCFTVQITDKDVLSFLNSGIGFLDMSLYADASYNVTPRLFNDRIDIRGMNLNDYEPLISSGFTIYFTPSGIYPDDYSPSIKISPGLQHHISLSMVNTELAINKGQCRNKAPDVQLLNLRDLQSRDFKYSLGLCYAQKINEVFGNLNCYLPGYSPILFSKRNLSSCLNFAEYFNRPNNLTAAETTIILAFLTSSSTIPTDVIKLVSDGMSSCQSERPCSNHEYLPKHSAVLFPLDVKSVEMVNIFKQLTAEREKNNYTVPGRKWIVSLFDETTKTGLTAAQSVEADEKLNRAVGQNLVRIKIYASEAMSTKYQQSLSFLAPDLMANIGGLMGLFLGCSVMTLMEIIELVACLIIGRHTTWISNDQSVKISDHQQDPDAIRNSNCELNQIQNRDNLSSNVEYPINFDSQKSK